LWDVNLLNGKFANQISVMNIPQDILNQIEDHSRIWIYQAERFLSEEEALQIEAKAQAFVKQWTAHEQALHAKSFVLMNLFLVLSVDEHVHQASGCSIDKSVALIKQLNLDYGIDLLQRTNIAMVNQEAIEIVPLDRIMKEGVDGSVLFFNNLIQYGKQLKQEWLIKAEDGWLRRYQLTASK